MLKHNSGSSANNRFPKIANTHRHVEFSCPPSKYITKWFAESPTHHCAIAVGHIAANIEKLGELMKIKTVRI